MSTNGKIVTGCLAPHPPHLVYASNPDRNEPRSRDAGPWKVLLDGYANLRRRLAQRDFDVIVVHTPHWKTVVGTHLLGVERFSGYSVDPIFPNLFRFRFDLKVDVELSRAIHDEGQEAGLVMKMMENPEFRVDYGTLTALHLTRPAFDLPIVCISSNRAYFYYSNEVGDREMTALGQATRRAIRRTGRRALCLASCSLSHRHFTEEPAIPEDPAFEGIYNQNQRRWDEHILDLIARGETRRVMDEMPDFIQQTMSETSDGSLSWLLAAMDFPAIPGKVHAYGTVIGTGNAIVEWNLEPGGDEDGP